MKFKFLYTILAFSVLSSSASAMRNQAGVAGQVIDLCNQASNNDFHLSHDDIRLLLILQKEVMSGMRSRYYIKNPDVSLTSLMRALFDARECIVNRDGFVQYRPIIDWHYCLPHEFESVDNLIKNVNLDPHCSFCLAMINGFINHDNVVHYSSWCMYHRLWVEEISDILRNEKPIFKNCMPCRICNLEIKNHSGDGNNGLLHLGFGNKLDSEQSVRLQQDDTKLDESNFLSQKKRNKSKKENGKGKSRHRVRSVKGNKLPKHKSKKFGRK